MKAYFLTIIVASLGAALVERLSPLGEGGRLAGYTRMVAGLYLLVVILLPLRDGLGQFSDLVSGENDLVGKLEEAVSRPVDEYEGVFAAQLAQLGAAEVEGYVRETLATQFNIKEDHVQVEARLRGTTEGAVALEEVRIALSGEGALRDPVPIEAYFSEALICPCYVSVEP